MTPADALRDAALAGRLGQFEISRHCQERMSQRNVTRRDICCALESATQADQQDVPEKWRLTGGCDDDGEPLGIVIVFSGRRLIVTVF